MEPCYYIGLKTRLSNQSLSLAPMIGDLTLQSLSLLCLSLDPRIGDLTLQSLFVDPRIGDLTLQSLSLDPAWDWRPNSPKPCPGP